MRILTLEQAAKLMFISHEKMRKLLTSGEIKAYKSGKQWRIPEENVLEAIRRFAEEGRQL